MLESPMYGFEKISVRCPCVRACVLTYGSKKNICDRPIQYNNLVGNTFRENIHECLSILLPDLGQSLLFVLTYKKIFEHCIKKFVFVFAILI